MERRIHITSSSNPRLKTIRRLRRGRAGAFLVEGFRQVSCALEAGAPIRELLLAPDLWLGTSEAELAGAGCDVLELSVRAFESISSHVRPDGVAAVVERWSRASATCVSSDPLVLVAEALERPGNLETIVRSTCAAGADALVVADGRTDLFHPETVRGSVGTLFRLPLRKADGRRDRMASRARPAHRRRDACRRRAMLGGRPHRPTAIVVGNERYGVSRGGSTLQTRR